MLYVGINGCRAGWLAVTLDTEGVWTSHVHRTFAELWETWRKADQILVDLPIGLPHSGPERACDREARRKIGERRSSVFPVPCRHALAATSFGAASKLNRRYTGRGLSKQSWAILPKIREVDELMRSDPGARLSIRSAHPEILFWSLNGGIGLKHPKKRNAGRLERIAILERHYGSAREVVDRTLVRFPRSEVAVDDVIDALAAAVVARIARGSFATLPTEPDRDAFDLPMEMVHVRNGSS